MTHWIIDCRLKCPLPIFSSCQAKGGHHVFTAGKPSMSLQQSLAESWPARPWVEWRRKWKKTSAWLSSSSCSPIGVVLADCTRCRMEFVPRQLPRGKSMASDGQNFSVETHRKDTETRKWYPYRDRTCCSWLSIEQKEECRRFRHGMWLAPQALTWTMRVIS